MKVYWFLIALLLCTFCALAVVNSVPSVAPIQSTSLGYVNGVTEGDTNRPSIWYSDNLTYGAGFGDGHLSTCDNTAGRFFHLIFATWAYNYATNALSATLVNCMLGYVNTQANACTVHGLTASAGDDGFARGTTMYQFIDCQTGDPTFESFMQFLIMSPDKGLHWCNWARFQGGSVASGANTCDSNNWQTNGDPCPDDNQTINPDFTGGSNVYACVQMDWRGAVVKRIPQRYSLVQVSKVGATPPVITGADTTNCLYFISNVPTGADNVTHGMYASRHCHLTTQANVMDLPNQMDYWDGAAWQTYQGVSGVPSVAQAANIIPSSWATGTVFSQTAVYLVDFGAFILTGDNGGTTAEGTLNAYAALPQGAYTALSATVAPTVAGCTNYSTYMLSTYAALGDGFRLTRVCSGSVGDGAYQYVAVGTTNWFRPPTSRSGAGTQ